MTTIKHIRRFTAALVMMTLAACGDSSTGPSAQTALVVENASPQTIYIVNFGPCTDPTWGPDRLGATETIAAGAERSWTVQPGCYDVRVKTEAGNAEWYGLEIERGKQKRVKAQTYSASLVAASAKQ